MVSEADRILVERAKSGDSKAFEVLVRRYQGKVAAAIARRVSDHGKIQDLVQEVFIKVYRALPSFRGESAFYTWVYRIAINTVTNHYLAENREVAVDDAVDLSDDSEHMLPQMQDRETPETGLLRRELAAVIQQAIDGLTPTMREVIVLRELQGKSYEEIADQLRCPVGTVRSRIFRGRQELAERLSRYLQSGLV